MLSSAALFLLEVPAELRQARKGDFFEEREDMAFDPLAELEKPYGSYSDLSGGGSTLLLGIVATQ